LHQARGAAPPAGDVVDVSRLQVRQGRRMGRAVMAVEVTKVGTR
jgi:hypothetical protein